MKWISWSSGFLICALAGAVGAAAQTGPFVPEHPLEVRMTDRQRIALESIASQPIDLHPAILTVASDVPLLLRIEALWRDFELALEPIVSTYDDAERAALQDLLRYPGLVPLLLETAPQGDAALTRALADYPESIRDVARAAGAGHRALLAQIEARRAGAIQRFEELIADHPDGTRAAYRDVVGHPELVEELIEHLDTTEMLAGSARVDLAGTLAGLSDLHVQVERARAQWAADQARQAEARRQAELARAERKRERREARLDRGYYWGGSACGYGYGYGRWGGAGRCWYPWHHYGRRWW